ncbi:hypothetical protein HF086_010964 [Spodoptera exigua]|uniref:p53 DNA-binding domain-containing protein n=1 Tax=Spodoptera exigua TaxID=7107 RepID=A0A922MN79_SPOEX|nr:hypothetical protein HF086_010964 [Spodoptera exigua]
MADSWYSVLVQFDRTGPEPCSHAYQFACKNSCTTGINRRAIAIIFTLEDKTYVFLSHRHINSLCETTVFEAQLKW